jgi:hypothetical protein
MTLGGDFFGLFRLKKIKKKQLKWSILANSRKKFKKGLF